MLLPRALLPVAAAVAAAAGARATTSEDLRSIISATHWSPCYYMTSAPSLWDGASALATTGTTAIKVIMEADPSGAYPWNTDWAEIMANVSTLADLASTAVYDAVFRGNADGRLPPGKWDYDTFAIVTYRALGVVGSSKGWNYWCQEFGPDDAKNETADFAGLTAHFLSAFSGTGKRFMLEHWEGDWSARCGSYDPATPADPAVQARMVQWLAARQAGVNQGRADWCGSAVARGALPASFDCSDGRSVHAAAGVEVFHASEVNLVGSSMSSGFPNNILQVIPRVALDMVSYSSYDTMALNPGFGQALDFIAGHHNRTPAAPTPGVFVAEYGVAQMEVPEPGFDVAAVYTNVNGWALSIGPQGARRAAATFAWELFDNEVREGTPGFPGQRCNPVTGPQFNESRLNGFWMVRPDGSASPSYDFIAGVLNGSRPAPTPVPQGSCSYTADTDIQGTNGQVVNASSRQECCAACFADVRCVASVWAGAAAGQCYTKHAGGYPVKKDGVTLCTVQDHAGRGSSGGGTGAAQPRRRPFPAHAFPAEWVEAGGLHMLQQGPA